MNKKHNVVPEGLEVIVHHSNDAKKDRSNFDQALREFKKKVKQSGILNELRRREAYMSPSKYKRYRKNEAIKQRRRDEKKQNWSNEQTEW